MPLPGDQQPDGALENAPASRSGLTRRRLFVGTFISDEDRAKLAGLKKFDERLNSLWQSRMRWVRPEKLHLTWLFLGDVQEEFVSAVGQSLHLSLRGFSSTTVEYDHLALWPKPRQPRQLVLASSLVAPEIYDIAAAIKHGLREYAEKEETRRYKPHLTLLRFDRERHGKPQRLDFPNWFPPAHFLPLIHRIDRICLIESLMGRGDTYEALTTIQLS